MELILYGGKRVDNEQANNKIATRCIMGYKETDRGRSEAQSKLTGLREGLPGEVTVIWSRRQPCNKPRWQQ